MQKYVVEATRIDKFDRSRSVRVWTWAASAAKAVANARHRLCGKGEFLREVKVSLAEV